MTDIRVLTLPGWKGAGLDDWQAAWEQSLGCERVEQDDWLWPRRGDWMARLDEVLLRSERPAILLAHGLGCHLAAAWSAHSRHPQRVRAALLVAAPDLERDDVPPQLYGWRQVPQQPLPFPSLMVIGEDDPQITPERAAALAARWRAQPVRPEARPPWGDWPQGQAWLAGLKHRSLAPSAT